MTTTLTETTAAPGPDFATIVIAGAVFPAGFTGEVDLLDVTGALSDRILFDNSSGNATINFLSDDESGNLPQGPVPGYQLLLPLAFENAPAVVNVPIIDTTSLLTYSMQAVMVSDIDSAIFTPFSDSINLSIPEPGSIFLAVWTGRFRSELPCGALRTLD